MTGVQTCALPISNTSDGTYEATMLIEYPINNQKRSNNNSSLAGRWNLVSRSDGKNFTNYYYIDISNQGTYSECYEPKHSPGYKGGHSGNWKQDNGQLILTNGSGVSSGTYYIKGDEIHRVTSSGTTFIFKR